MGKFTILARSRPTTGERSSPRNYGDNETGDNTKGRKRYEGEELLDYQEDDSDGSGMDVDEAAALAGKLRLQSTNSSVFESGTANKSNPALHQLNSDAPGSDSCQLPDEYIRARTARRIDSELKRLPGIGKLSRSSEQEVRQFACGNFDSITDKRLAEVFKVHSVARRANYSMSFDPERLTCTACLNEHAIIEQKKPVCIVLSDQNFPPHMSGGGDGSESDPGTGARHSCPAIVRVEDGKLSELQAIFCDIFGRKLADGAGLPAGSVIMINSLSDLGGVGLEKYAEDLARTISGI